MVQAVIRSRWKTHKTQALKPNQCSDLFLTHHQHHCDHHHHHSHCNDTLPPTDQNTRTHTHTVTQMHGRRYPNACEIINPVAFHYRSPAISIDLPHGRSVGGGLRVPNESIVRCRVCLERGQHHSASALQDALLLILKLAENVIERRARSTQ